MGNENEVDQKRGNSKRGFFSWVGNIPVTFQTAFRLIVQYLAARKREDETFVLVLNRAYILKCN